MTATIQDGLGIGIPFIKDFDITVTEAGQPGYLITIDPAISNGSVSAQGGLTEAKAGDTVSLTVTPDADYRLAAGSLKYNTTLITGTSFIMPDEDVTIYAEFEPVPDTPSVSQDSVSMAEGESATFVVYLGNGTDAADLATVTSANGDIATATPTNIVVTGTQVTVTGHSAGSTTISLGWSGGTLDGQTETVNVEVTARNQPPVNYTVTFDPNGGTRTGGGALTQTVPAGGSATAPIVTRSGYTFTGWERSFFNVQANMTVKANWSRDSRGSPSGGDYGGSSSSDSGSGTGYTAQPSNGPADITTTAATTAAKDAAAKAKVSGATVATVNIKNPGKITLAALQAMTETAGMPVKFQADSMSGSAVDVRITFDPALATKELNLSASTVNATAKARKAFFEKWFSNPVSVVSLGQQGSFGQPMEIAAKVDPALDTDNLVFYSYNRETNTYSRIAEPKYWIDKNGYVHFTTELAGDIIISEDTLQKKEA